MHAVKTLYVANTKRATEDMSNKTVGHRRLISQFEIKNPFEF